MPNTTYILGAGALGLLFATKLARTSRVGLLVKPLHTNNLSLGINYQATASAASKKVFIKLLSQPTPNLKINRLILATKASQAAKALSQWQDNLAKDSQILLLQNGMGSQAEVAKLLLPSQSLLAASVAQAAYLKAANQVVEAGQGVSQLGYWQGPNPEVTQQWLSRLTTAGLSFRLTSNIRQALWHKLAVNAVINPLTALHKVANGQLASSEFQPQVKALIEEISLLFSRLGISQPEGGLKANIDTIILATAQNFSSMYQDLTQGKITEIDYITASLLKAAKAARIQLPEHEKLYQQIKELENHA